MGTTTDDLIEFITRGHSVPQSGSAFGLFLDDLLAQFGWNNGKHSRAITIEERRFVFEATKMYADLVGCSHPFTDILSPVYEAMVVRPHQKALGQHLTPPAVTDLLTNLTFTNTFDVYGEGPIHIHEPAVGAGGLPLSVCRRALEQGIPVQRLHFALNDIDIQCVKMTTIQFLANGLLHQQLPGGLNITHGDIVKMGLRPFLTFPVPSEVKSPATNCRACA